MVKNEFIQSLEKHRAAFDLQISAETTARLADYYEIVRKWNPRLHLVAPCAPEEFAVRHVLESLMLTKFLSAGATFADVGTGAGLPSIPCLIARDDLKGFLIESNAKKAVFLREAASALEIRETAQIINRRFEDSDVSAAAFITSRALDKLSENLSAMIEWTGAKTLILFGGDKLREQIKTLGINFTEKLIPLSERRFIFVLLKKN